MKSKKFTSITLSILVSIFFVSLINIQKVKADDTARISFFISSDTLKKGDTFDIYVIGNNIVDLYGASIDVSFNLNKMQILSIDKGDGLKDFTKIALSNNTNGIFNFGASLSGDVPGYTFNNQSLFIIHAKALQSGNIILNTSNSSSDNFISSINIKLSNSSVQPINYTLSSLNTYVSDQINTAGFYEENNSAIRYVGNWSVYNDSQCSGGSEKFSNTLGSYIEFPFTGTGIRWISDSNQYSGIAKVTIDNEVLNIDNYSSYSIFKRAVFEKTNLSYGNHIIKIEVLGKNNSSKASNVVLDAFEVINSRIEESNSNIVYNGNWWNYDNSLCSGNREKYTSSIGSSIEYTFTGTGIRWISDSNQYSGIAKVTIDGISTTVDNYNNNSDFRKVVFEATNLSLDKHTIKIEAIGKNINAKGSNIVIDALDVLNNANMYNESTKFEESSSSINYSGNWDTYYDNNLNNGAERYNSTIGSYLEFSFTGTGIRWISDSNSDSGIARVTLDGVSADIDNYSPTSIIKKVAFEKNNLQYGTHTLRIEVLGKNINAQRSNVTLDTLEVINERYEENSNRIKYSGNWLNYQDQQCSNYSEQYSYSIDSYAEFNFVGTGIRWISDSNQSSGIAKVTIDGISSIIDNYNSSSIFKKIAFEKNNLQYGNHLIKIEVYGKNSKSKSSNVVIDSLEPLNGTSIDQQITKYEDTNSLLKYSSNWWPYYNNLCSGGSEKYSSTMGSYVDFTFTGTGIRWISDSNQYSGIARVTLDGSSIDIDNYSTLDVYNKISFEQTGLNYGTHTLRIEVIGKNPNSKASNLVIDALEVINSRYEENNSNLKYEGSWFNYQDSQCSNGIEKYSYLLNSSVEFNFIGTGIRWISDSNQYSGIAKITIDGVPFIVDNYSTSSTFNKIVFEKYGLSYGNHTIRISVNGKNPNSKASNVVIDALETIK